MKIVFVGLFALFAFVVGTNANFSSSPRIDINLTGKFQKKLKNITDGIPEPIVLSDVNLQPIENLNVILSGTISGLKNLTCNDLKVGVGIGGLKISSFEFVLPKLRIDITNYDLDGKLGLTPIYGKGQIVLDIDDLKLKGNAQLGIKTVDDVKLAHLTLINAKLSLDQNTFNFKITGWLNDEIRSEFLSQTINNIVHHIPPESMQIVDEELSKILTTLVADFTIPVSELTKP